MFTHVYRYDRTAVHVDPDGNKLGDKYVRGDWKCLACKALASFCIKYDLDHAGDCPGFIQAAPADSWLPEVTSASSGTRPVPALQEFPEETPGCP